MQAHTITLSDIVAYIEANKRVAELRFKEKLLGIDKKDETDETKKEILQLENLRGKIGKTLVQLDLTVAMPHETKIHELTKKLEGVPEEKIAQALREKKGHLYETLVERGTIIRSNFENRLEIAKIHLLMLQFPKEIRVALRELLRNGKIDGNISCAQNRNTDLFIRLLSRVGIQVAYAENAFIAPPIQQDVEEIPLILQNRKIWVHRSKKEQISGLDGELQRISTKIQLWNAERQVKVFSESEEKEFGDLQSEYLLLLKNIDELLDEYAQEERACL